MKKLLLIICLLAFAAVLGTVAKEKEKEPSRPVVIGGETNYPHSTGMCYCGQYASCHPKPEPRTTEDKNGNIYIWPPR